MHLISFLPVRFCQIQGKDICLSILKISQLRSFCLEKKMHQSKITNHFSYKFKILLSSQADLFKIAKCIFYIFYIPRMIGAKPIIYIRCLYIYFMLTSKQDSGTSHICAWVSLSACSTVQILSVTAPFS